ncbi:conserved hypothetical protein [Lebetimonas natsushimae]|uniref:ACT domain-containing protein n=1 Tax=Lebetimonas natsushimae TaxID=1936991 RepID=A0A292YDX5_9BACT|nr:amino acid-binding protein [Lebetimonas natsushimae]GAX87576.1 conserved hypothetical protein [Lebetimonas natsushimae]
MKQISVFLERKKGRLKEITQSLAKEGVNIKAITLVESSEFGILRMLTEDIAKACEAIEKNGFSLTLSDILVVEVDDEIGAFNKIVSVLSENDIDINYCYTVNSDKKGAFAFKVSDLNRAKNLLKGFRVY